MANRLTKKQRGFVKDYVKTGIGEIAAMNNYDTTDGNTARSIASENLTKPNIQKAIADMIPDGLLSERHLELLNKRDIKGNVDVIAVSKGLDMGYKLKGSYAPDKNINMNLNVKTVDPTDEIILQALRVIQEKMENETI